MTSFILLSLGRIAVLYIFYILGVVHRERQIREAAQTSKPVRIVDTVYMVRLDEVAPKNEGQPHE